MPNMPISVIIMAQALHISCINVEYVFYNGDMHAHTHVYIYSLGHTGIPYQGMREVNGHPELVSPQMS